jgi:predicted 3-demethylubiquinone-9 3-methyltransferase (glyoxalase superfamily)
MQKIITNLWFDRNAKEAVDFYISVFPESKIISTQYYPTAQYLEDFQQEFAEKVLTIEFELFGTHYIAINAGSEFPLTEAVSLAIFCKDQTEIDMYWDAITKNGGQESVCGWCKDKFGLSWQIAPTGIDELVNDPKKFTNMMKMKKIIIADL